MEEMCAVWRDSHEVPHPVFDRKLPEIPTLYDVEPTIDTPSFDEVRYATAWAYVLTAFAAVQFVAMAQGLGLFEGNHLTRSIMRQAAAIRAY